MSWQGRACAFARALALATLTAGLSALAGVAVAGDTAPPSAAQVQRFTHADASLQADGQAEQQEVVALEHRWSQRYPSPNRNSDE